jgi:hypothetical protein
MTLGHSIGIFSGGAYGLLVVAAYCLPETNGKELTDTEGGMLDYLGAKTGLGSGKV